MRSLLIATAALLMAGCGGGGNADLEDPARQDGDLPVIGVRVVDSIGVEIGDSNYVMGAIEDLCYGPDGNIAVLDRARSCVRIYTPRGEFLRRIGCKGSGPGELQDIAFLAISEDGHLYISGEGSEILGIHQYDYFSGEWLGSLSTGSPPTCLEGVDGSDYVRKDLRVDPSSDELRVILTIARYEPGADEPSTVYFEDNFPFDPSNLARVVDLIWEGYDIAADGGGGVYVAPRSTEEAVVTAYQKDGSVSFSITLDLESVPRTEREMEMERLILRSRAAVMDLDQTQLEPDPMKPLVRGLEIDGEGNIWVLRGGPATPTFDVFDGSGRPVCTAVVEGEPEDGSTWRFHMDEHGMLAYAGDPACGFQKVYILESDSF
ncbi:MAG: hypothetical protein JXA64_00045 [Candidatus Fermentibacteraceae bacterium]|nr:hypothetical protein [Candidatus Fermentibacteraceae bacterium]MBN2607474.1 hypothetical protein [Candidatus Fermentibacteraceae bacterium]